MIIASPLAGWCGKPFILSHSPGIGAAAAGSTLRMEKSAQFDREPLRREGLAQVGDGRIGAVAGCAVIDVAAHHEGGHGWAQSTDLDHQLPAIDAGHADIRNDRVDFVDAGAGCGEAGVAVFAGDHGVTVAPQHSREEIADGAIVLDHQNGSSGTGNRSTWLDLLQKALRAQSYIKGSPMPNESSSGETANSNQVSQRGRVARRFSVMRARGCCSIKR